MNSVPLLCTIPSWIPLQNLQCLKISNGRLGRLLGEQVPFHLKELVLEGAVLEEFPDSLGMLRHLEVLVVRGRAEWSGTEWDYPMQIDGRAFSDSLTELINLKTLVLRDLALSGELTLNNSREWSPTVSLKSIDIRDVKLAFKVIISAEYLRSLKSLHIESMENLIEVGLGLGVTPKYPESDTGEFSEAEELSSFACEICLERMIIEGCWALQKITGIEKLGGLKCVQVSARNAAVRRCIDTWQRLPAQVASVIWNPAVETWVSVTSYDFQRCVQEDDTVIKIHTVSGLSKGSRHRVLDPAVDVTPQPSAIVIFMLIRIMEKDSQKVLKMPLLDWRVCSIAEGLNAVVVLVTDEERINKMLYGVNNWIPEVTDGKVENAFLITVNETQKLEVLLSILKEERMTELQKARSKGKGFRRDLLPGGGNETQKLEVLFSILKEERMTELQKARSKGKGFRRDLLPGGGTGEILESQMGEIFRQRMVELQKHIAKYEVGITEILQDFKRACWQETGRARARARQMIGIYGLGGSGKSTLTRAFVNRNRSKYTESSFLFEVRRSSNNGNLTVLQSKLLRDLFHKDRAFYSIPEGSNYLRSRLQRDPHVSFLICIDDVDHPKQLDDLVGWDNSSSSLIIVTSRDERVLIQAGVSSRYKMKEMNDSQSTELFCWHASHQPYPSSGSEDLVKRIVKECKGLPVALNVLGGHVFGRAYEHWEIELEKGRKSLRDAI